MGFYQIRERKMLRLPEVDKVMSSQAEDYRFSRFHKLDAISEVITLTEDRAELVNLDFWLAADVAPMFNSNLTKIIMDHTPEDNLLSRKVVIESPSWRFDYYLLLPRVIDVYSRRDGSLLEDRCGRWTIFKAEGREEQIVVREEMYGVLRRYTQRVSDTNLFFVQMCM